MSVEWVGRGREGVIIKRIVTCDVTGANVLTPACWEARVLPAAMGREDVV